MMPVKRLILAASSVTMLVIICNRASAASWSYAISSGQPIIGSPAIGADGNVYVTSADGYLYSINPTTHSLNWSADLSNNSGVPTSSPTIAPDGTIYVASTDNSSPMLYAVNSANGTAAPLYALGLNENDDDSNTGDSLGTPAIGADGTIYVTSDDNSDSLFAIKPDGSDKWSPVAWNNNYGIGSNEGASSAAVGPDGTVYFFTEGGQLDAINSNGSLKWQWSIPNANQNVFDIFDSSLAIGADGTIYVVSHYMDYSTTDAYGANPEYGALYAITPQGFSKWAWLTPGNSDLTAPVTGPHGTIYVGSSDSYLYALDSCGDQKWAKQTSGGNAIYAAPVLGTNSDGTTIIYVGDNGGNLDVTDGSANTPLSIYFSVGAAIHSSPAIGADGTVYFGADNGSLYAVAGTAHLAGSAWPMICGNVHHTSIQSVLGSLPVCPASVDSAFRASIGSPGNVYAMAVQTNGQILVAGTFSEVDGQSRANVVRLNPDGSVDPNFNASAAVSEYLLDAYCIAVDSNGKIYVGGDGYPQLGSPTNGESGYLLRLNSDGSLDTTFNVTEFIGPYAFVQTLSLPNGGIYNPENDVTVCGDFTSYGGFDTYGYPSEPIGSVGDVFMGDGSADEPEISAGGQVWSYLSLTNGSGSVVGGYFNSFDGQPADNLAALINYTPVAMETGNSMVFGLAQVSGGKILAAGEFGVQRYNADGSLDGTFNPPALDYAQACLLPEPDGKILVGGGGLQPESSSGLGRLNADGTWDDTFNIGVNGQVNCLVREPDGAVLVGGSFSSVGGQTHQGIARFYPND